MYVGFSIAFLWVSYGFSIFCRFGVMFVLVLRTSGDFSSAGPYLKTFWGLFFSRHPSCKVFYWVCCRISMGFLWVSVVFLNLGTQKGKRREKNTCKTKDL